MRRLSLLALAVTLALPASAVALKRGPNDGTLVVDNGRGLVTVSARGGIIGRFDTGRLIIDDPVARDGSGPIVYGAERIRELGATRTLYIGQDVRFRLIGGLYRVRIQAVGMDVSAVGRGTILLDGGGFTDAGRYSLDGAAFQPMPSVPTKLALGSSPNILDRR